MTKPRIKQFMCPLNQATIFQYSNNNNNHNHNNKNNNNLISVHVLCKAFNIYYFIYSYENVTNKNYHSFNSRTELLLLPIFKSAPSLVLCNPNPTILLFKPKTLKSPLIHLFLSYLHSLRQQIISQI